MKGDAGPCRSCPLHYRYPDSVFSTAPSIEAEVLYVVGGLYGNPFALDALLERVARERLAARIVFNGDFHWFDADEALFGRINRGVLGHAALRGNVETEITAVDDSDAGCGCGYPDWVDDADVDRSNHILGRLREVACGDPDALARLATLPMHAIARVGGARIALVHGDTGSLAGWDFSQERLAADPAAVATLLGRVDADVIACTHTCLPVAQRFATARGERWLVNNGSAGMANFAGDPRGLVTRIAPEPAADALYRGGALGGRLSVEAIPLDWNHAEWLRTFDALWPAGSDAALSYRRRIVQGPAYPLERAARDGFAPAGAAARRGQFA